MRFLFLALLAVAVVPAAPLRLGPGEYRWIPFTVKRVPTGVDCRFRVLGGGATVHMEIMSAQEFRRFNRGREYDALATAPDGRGGEIRRLMDERGEFAVVVANDDRAPVAMVDVEVSTDLNPSADSMARELSPGRRLAVILISFGIFFGGVTWSGLRLLRAAKWGRDKSYTNGMKTTISIPDEVFEGGERLARLTGKSRSRLFCDAVREYVARHAPTKLRRP